MDSKTERLGQDALNVVSDLNSQGINRMAVVLRHSAREYDFENLWMERYLGLTDEGKEFALTFGKDLPTDPLLRLYSSASARCVETAYQIEKGKISIGGKTETNRLARELLTFYAMNSRKALAINIEKGDTQLFRDWFDHKIPLDILADPEESGETIVSYLVDLLTGIQETHIDVHVTHDWNLYLLKELYLGLPLEKVGGVTYLEGIILYEDGGEFYVTNHQTAPKRLKRISGLFNH